MSRTRWLRLSALGACGFLLTSAALVTNRLTPPEISIVWQSPDSGYVPPVGAVEPGPELALVFIGSPTCVWSNRDFLPAAVEKAKLVLDEQARSTGRSFTTVASVKSSGVDVGLAYLRKFGKFDEIVLGRGWYNLGILRYVFEDFSANAATPQLVVVERRVVGWPSRSYADEKVLVRKIGAGPIHDWVEAGLPLPQNTQVAPATGAILPIDG